MPRALGLLIRATQNSMSGSGYLINLDRSGAPPVANAGVAPALSANVLVLNKYYQAIRVINVKRAFSLLCRELAEVIPIEPDDAGKAQWQNLDFAEWQELSALKKE